MPKSDITTIAEAYHKMCGEATSLFEKQQKRIAELEKEVQHLSDEGSWIARFRRLELECESHTADWWDDYEKLRELTAKIKRELSDGPRDYQARENPVMKIRRIKTENNKLKEENNKLKEGTLLKFQEIEIQDLQAQLKALQEKYDQLMALHSKEWWG